jgi:hypothetical protein
LKKHLAVILSALMIVMSVAPVLSAASYTPAQIKQYWMNVCKQAQTDADKDTNFFIWFGVGCLVGPLGVLASYFIVPTNNAERLIGKNSAYVSQYNKCYHDAVIASQSGKAWWGCGTEVVVGLVAYLIIAALAVKTVSSAASAASSY